MSHQNAEATLKLALLAFSHALDLVRDVFDIEPVELPGSQAARLLVRPCDDIPIVAGIGDRILGLVRKGRVHENSLLQ
jgi:hypothetical protein